MDGVEKPSEKESLLFHSKKNIAMENKGSHRLGKRHVLAVMAFLGFFNVYCLRVNLSVALVAMVNSTTSSNQNLSVECPKAEEPNSTNKASTEQGEFDWDESTQGMILGAFFYGYICTQLPGGWLAEQIGGKRLFGGGVLCTSLLTLLTPLAARAGLGWFVALRVLEGIGEGVTFPAMHAVWGHWAPLLERSHLVSFSYAGGQLGSVFAMPVSGLLCQHGFAGGWPSVFYVFGALGCVWFVAWMMLVHDKPSQHPAISSSEKEYIEKTVGHKGEKIPTPLFSILTSSAVWGTAIGHFANNWGFYSMLTCLPTYMKKILQFDIEQDGLLSSLPYLVLWIMQMTSGFVADYLRGHGYLSTAATRKTLNTLGLVIPASLMIATGYAGCNHTLAVVFLTLAVGSGGLTMAGYNVNHLDIAPKFAGTLMGITNMIATIPGFVGPAVVGILTNHNQTSGQWRLFFFITAGIYLAGAILFCILARGEEQSWANPTSSQKTSCQPQDQEVSLQVQS